MAGRAGCGRTGLPGWLVKPSQTGWGEVQPAFAEASARQEFKVQGSKLNYVGRNWVAGAGKRQRRSGRSNPVKPREEV